MRALADRASITIGLFPLFLRPSLPPSRLTSSRTVNCGGNNSAEEDGYDYPARFRSPPSDFHNPSPGRGEEKAGESGGEVGGRDEYEMRSESSRRGSGAGGEMRGEG